VRDLSDDQASGAGGAINNKNDGLIIWKQYRIGLLVLSGEKQNTHGTYGKGVRSPRWDRVIGFNSTSRSMEITIPLEGLGLEAERNSQPISI
jgi:hypothetical protein